MSPLFGKLNLGKHAVIQVLGAPASFEPELDDASTSLAASCEGDAVLWMAYPKKASKAYRCSFHRDSGWTVLGAAGFEPVRIVSIDDDWSALRFRRVEHIKTMARLATGAISEPGRRKASSVRA